MSEVGRYRKLYLRLWQHPGFIALTDTQKILAIYLLTGPQTNRLGLYTLSFAQAAEHLDAHRSASARTVQNLKRDCGVVCRAFGWSYDAAARVMYIPSWFTWNPPENANVVKGSLKDLNEIPSCRLVDLFAANVETLPQTLRAPFLEGLKERLPKPCPNQEQEQEQYQEQEPVHVPALTRGRALTATNASGTNGTGLRERFEAFWSVYPKKIAKDAAWKAWQKRKPNVELTEQMCATLAWQRTQDSWLKDGGQYIPNPEKWLNAGRWQDERSTTPRLNDSTIAIGRAVEEFLK